MKIIKTKPPVGKHVLLFFDGGRWTPGSLTDKGWYAVQVGAGSVECSAKDGELGRVLEPVIGYVDVDAEIGG